MTLRARTTSGTTLIELVVALAVATVALLAFFGALVSGSRLDRHTRERACATHRAQTVLEARLIHKDAGMLRVSGRTWLTTGAYVPPSGWESVTYLTGSMLLRIYGHFAAGLEITAALRRSKFEDFTYDRTLRGGLIRLTLTYLSEENFGANEAVR